MPATTASNPSSMPAKSETTYAPSETPYSPMEVAPWALIHDTRRRMSHTACVNPWTVFIMSKDKNGSPLTKVTLRAPCNGSTGMAMLSPSSRCSLAVCRPMKSMKG